MDLFLKFHKFILHIIWNHLHGNRLNFSIIWSFQIFCYCLTIPYTLVKLSFYNGHWLSRFNRRIKNIDNIIRKQRNHSKFNMMELAVGLEPTTSGLRIRCATICAIPAYRGRSPLCAKSVIVNCPIKCL